MTDIIKPLHFQFKEILNEKLKNGSKLTVYDSDYNKSMFCMIVNCGSFDEGFENKKTKEFKTVNGLAHLIEHLLFTNKILENMIRENNNEYNAITDSSITMYYFESLHYEIEDTLKVFFDILYNIEKQFTKELIESQIQAITNENLKNLSIESARNFLLVRNLSENLFFSSDDCGNNKTLGIENIENYAKLFFTTFYVPENIRFIFFTNTKEINIETVKHIFQPYSIFYTKEFLNEKLIKKSSDKTFEFTINKKRNFDILISKKYIKPKTFISLFNSHGNEIYIFFNVKAKNHHYINFIYWIFNRKDKKGIYEILKKYFMIIKISFSSSFAYCLEDSNVYFCYFNVMLNESNLNNNQIQNILNILFSYIESLKSLDKEFFENLITYYNNEQFLNSSYSYEFSNYCVDIFTNTILSNVKLDFNEDNLLLKYYDCDFKFIQTEFNNILGCLDLNNSFLFYYLNDTTIKKLTNSEFQSFSGFKLKYYKKDLDKKFSISVKFPKDIFTNEEKLISEQKKIISVTKKNKKESETLKIKKTRNLIKSITNEYSLNGVDVMIGFSEFLSFHITSSIKFKFFFNKKIDLIYQILNVLLIFEIINHKIEDKFTFLQPTDFLTYYKFDKVNYVITVTIHSLKEYYFLVFDDLIKYVKIFTKPKPTYKDLEKDLELGYCNLKENILTSISKEKFNDKIDFQSLFYEKYIHMEDILTSIDNSRQNTFDFLPIEIQSLRICSYLNIGKEKEETLTKFLNQIELLCNGIIIKNKKDDYYDLDTLKQSAFDKFLIKYKKNTIDGDSILSKGLYRYFKDLIYDLDANENYLFSFFINIPVEEIYKTLYLCIFFKNLLTNDFFNVFRTKKYSYTVYIKLQRIKRDFIIFKFSILINKNKLIEISQYEFIMKLYNEVKQFIKNKYNTFKKLSDEDINIQRINFMVFYTTINNDNITNLLRYEKFISIFDNPKEDIIVNEIISKISKDDILNFYKKNIIKNKLMVNIRSVD